MSYEFTVTVSPNKMVDKISKLRFNKITITEQWNWLQDQIIEAICLRTVSEAYDHEYRFVPELHKCGTRLHVHGHLIISHKDLLNKYEFAEILSRLNQIGRSTLSLINDEILWINYMNKDQEQMNNLCRKTMWYKNCVDQEGE